MTPTPDLPRDYTDRLLRSLWARAPDALLRLTLGDPDVSVRALLDTNVVLARKAPDGAALAEDQHGPFVGHLEYEVSPSSDLPVRVALYGLLLHQQHGLPVRSSVLVLGDQQGVQPRLTMEHGPQRLCEYNYRVLYIHDVPALTLAQSVDLAPLTPLGQGADADAVTLARDTLRAQAPPEQRADLLAAMYILGGRRFDGAWLLRIMTREELMESVTYRAILEEGFEKGEQRGLARGLARGHRELLSHLLALKFPEDAPSLDALLEGASTADIDAIAEALLHASTAEQLRDLMIARLRDRGD